MDHVTMTRRIFVTTSLTGIAGTALVACSSPDMDTGGDSDSDGDSTITLYTSEPEGKINEIIAAFNEEYPDVTVMLYRAGTGELTARIATESSAGDVQADVLLAADRPTFESYKSEGLLAPLEVPEADNLLEGVVDPDGYYVGTRIIPTVLAINTSAENTPPTSWADLTTSEYTSEVAMPSPDVSGAAAYNTAVWLGEDSLGEEWLRALMANQPTVLESNGPVAQAVADDTSSVGIVVDYLVRDLKEQGSPIDVVYPTEGVPFVDQPAAIFEASQNKEAAQAFINFLVSEEGQQIAADQNYTPVRADVTPPEGSPNPDDLTLFEPDVEEVSDAMPEAVELFGDLIDDN